jgi:Putative homoserine kinase type II (protein kinase fold)
MELRPLLEDICKKYDLGSPTNQAVRLYGGYMHKMYHLQTENGDFAVKLLNPMIMKRPDVFENYKRAEELEEKLQIAKIPIISALKFNNKRMQCVRGQYFYIFNYIDGKALNPEEIQKEHCAIIGKNLARIHKIEKNIGSGHTDEINIDWEHYIQLASSICPEIALLLNSNKSLLDTSQIEGNNAYKKLPNVTCICNGDMDRKNVLWSGYTPYIIDLECLDYGNPFLELFDLSLYWSGYEHCCVNYDLLEAFIQSYFLEYGSYQLDWSTLYSSNNGGLLWLEYNVKRALMIECENEEERLLGIEQVKETLERIIYYESIRETLIEKLTSFSFPLS